MSDTTTEVCPFTERRSVRHTTGGMRVFVNRTFTGTTQEQYDAFLDSRFRAGVDDCEWSTRRNSPTVEIDGRPRWANYSYNTHETLA